MSASAYLKVHLGDNIDILKNTPTSSIDMIYIDPPFNTGVKQIRKRFHTEDGTRIDEETYGYNDCFNDFIGFLRPRMEEAYRILKPHGSLFFHLDYREIHYCKVMLDEIFGRDSFINELIWAYDYGARSKKRWSAKHDNILWYAKDPENYIFNYDDMDRIPYMAPGLVGEEKAARGKTPTDVWWHTIVSPNSKEKTGYATQKPLGIIKRLVKIHSRVGDTIMDFFAGSGTLGEAAAQLNRNCILVDQNPEAIAVMKKRFRPYHAEWIDCEQIKEAAAPPVPVGCQASAEEEGFTQPIISFPPVQSPTTSSFTNATPKRRGRPPKKKTQLEFSTESSSPSEASTKILPSTSQEDESPSKASLFNKKHVTASTEQGSLL